MKPNQRGRWGKNVKQQIRGARRQNLVERNPEGGKGQRKIHATILKMGNIRETRSLTVGQMKSPRCGTR